MRGRPQADETAPYYFNYINCVTGDEPLATIEAQLPEALSFFSGIGEEKSLHRYAPGKWSIRQVLNHVTDTERAWAFRALWFARGFDSPLPSYDQDVAANHACANAVTWAANIEDFQRVREASISLIRNLPPEAWMRTGIASGNPFTVRALAYIIPGHVAHHLAVLKERYL
jgi:hypothetical protein